QLSAFSQPIKQPQQQQLAQTSSLSEEEKVFGPYEQQEQQPAQTAAAVQEKQNQPLCPTCNQPLTWIPQYKRWYCYTDKKYVSVSKKKFLGHMNRGSSNDKVKTDAQQPSNQPHCPTCDQPLTWIPQYKRWYCYTDKKYVSVSKKKFLGLMNSSESDNVKTDAQQQTNHLCPTCNQSLTWIPQYKRWYCYTDKKYV